MNIKSRNTRAMGVWTLYAAASAFTVALDAQAGPFSGSERVASVICDVADIRGEFSADRAAYAASGTCVQVQATNRTNQDGGSESKFPGAADSKVLFQAAWTATGGYDSTTKETWETITLPAPRTDERTAPGRPYGVFSSKMVCAADPWIGPGSPNCTAITVNAQGNLGEVEKMLRTLKQPLTRPAKLPQRQALQDAHALFAKRRAAMFSDSAQATQSPLRSFTLPEIVEPRAGSTHRPLTPMKIRVVAPKNLKIQTYLLQWERRQPDGRWLPTTNELVNAAEVEGALGYKGWGWHKPGTSGQMSATVGTYRLRAHASTPRQEEAGAWSEFTIAGEPGPQPGEFQTNKAVAAPALNRAPAAAQPAPPATMERSLNTVARPAVAAPSVAGASLQRAPSALKTQTQRQ